MTSDLSRSSLVFLNDAPALWHLLPFFANPPSGWMETSGRASLSRDGRYGSRQASELLLRPLLCVLGPVWDPDPQNTQHDAATTMLKHMRPTMEVCVGGILCLVSHFLNKVPF